MDVRNRIFKQMFGVMAVIGLLFTVGCASSKMTAKLSGEKIFEAEKAVSVARNGNASVNAKNELSVPAHALHCRVRPYPKGDDGQGPDRACE